MFALYCLTYISSSSSGALRVGDLPSSAGKARNTAGEGLRNMPLFQHEDEGAPDYTSM
jgi:hypothetical protein